MRVFVAGATGAIGQPLIANLLQQGHSVIGMTTSEAGAATLQRQGAESALVDVFDATAVDAALRRFKPDAVIDELTSLPKEQSDMPKYAEGDRKLRLEGGANLFRAAVANGVRRYLQQSSGFFLKSAPGTLADESSPLDVNASPGVAASARTYTELEARLFSSPAIEAVSLRYGFFYGPGTWYYPGASAANSSHAPADPGGRQRRGHLLLRPHPRRSQRHRSRAHRRRPASTTSSTTTRHPRVSGCLRSQSFSALHLHRTRPSKKWQQPQAKTPSTTQPN